MQLTSVSSWCSVSICILVCIILRYRPSVLQLTRIWVRKTDSSARSFFDFLNSSDFSSFILRLLTCLQALRIAAFL